MTTTREEILAMANQCFVVHTNGEIYATQPMIEFFFYLAYAAGQRDMQERAARVCLETGIKHPQQPSQEACSLAIRNLELKRKQTNDSYCRTV